MGDADQPFIAYRQGRWSLKIVPRNAHGWRAFGLWMALLLPPFGLFTALIMRQPQGMALVALVLCYGLTLTIWGVAMTRWMLARSEVVQVEDLLALKRQQDAQKRRP